MGSTACLEYARCGRACPENSTYATYANIEIEIGRRSTPAVGQAVSFVLRKCDDLSALTACVELYGATCDIVRTVVSGLSCQYARKKRAWISRERHVPDTLLAMCPTAWLGWMACNVDTPTDAEMDRLATLLPERLTARELDVRGNHNLVMWWLARHGRASQEDIAAQAERRGVLRERLDVRLAAFGSNGLRKYGL